MQKLIKVEESIASLLILVLTFLTLLQVVMRHVFQLPFPWVDEASRYLMIYMVFIGSAVALYKKEHLNVELLDMFLNDKKMRLVNITHQLAATLFSAVLAYFAIQFIIYQIEIGQKSPALQISMAWPMSVIVIGGLLMVISGVGSIYKSLYVKKGG